jgi:alginate production protein
MILLAAAIVMGGIPASPGEGSWRHVDDNWQPFQVIALAGDPEVAVPTDADAPPLADLDAPKETSGPADSVPDPDPEPEVEETVTVDAAQPTPLKMTGFGPMAQFQLPTVAGPRGGPARPVTQFLTYQYSFGSESDITHRRNRDLDQRLRDDFVLLAPQVNGYILYRPSADIETLLEMILEREFPVRQENTVVLPNGEVQHAPKRYTSLAIDQAWVKFKNVGPFEITVGRRNFEDDRHWLYDTSLDAIHARSKVGNFVIDAGVMRKDLFDGDLLAPVKRGHTNNYLLYGEYRGFEDIKLAGYAMRSHDSTGQEGRPRHLGMRAHGMPTDQFSFWTELALVRGKDEFHNKLSGYAVDAGFLYRFPDLPLRPGIMVGYAYGSGDANPNDSKNTEFRQTGLQSNEVKGAGVSKYKYYGETLDPELSNLRILSLGLGFRAAQNVYVDLVAHSYRLNQLATSLRNSELTAEMNQDESRPSKDVGRGVDLVIGLRNLFGIRRFGVDVRLGVFRPASAFRNETTDSLGNPVFVRAANSVSALVKFWW